MKWILFAFLGLVAVAAGVVIYLAYLILSGLGELYGPWTKQ